MSRSFYSSIEWHKLRAQTKKRWKAHGLPCGFCGKPIDWTAKPSVDHIHNRKQYPELALDPNNLQVVHHECNTRKAAWAENTTLKKIGEDGFPEGEGWG